LITTERDAPADTLPVSRIARLSEDEVGTRPQLVRRNAGLTAAVLGIGAVPSAALGAGWEDATRIGVLDAPSPTAGVLTLARLAIPAR